MIRFTCPKCSKHLKAAPAYAGKRVVCTRCGYSLHAPTPDANPDPNWLEPSEAVNLARKRISPLAIGLAFGAALIVMACIGVGVDLWLRDPNPSSLQNLKSSDPAIIKQALESLAESDPVDADRSSVTAALESLLVDPDAHKHLDPNEVLRVYLAWTNKDNVPAMTRMVQNPTMPGWNSQKTALVMDALAKLGDERAYPALAEKLADPVLHDQALTALRIVGPKSQSAVLAIAFDDNPITRQRAVMLLTEFGTTPKAIGAEAFGRLKSPQPAIRRSAVGWFVENAPNDDTQKIAGAKLLGKLLVDQPPEVCGKVLQALKMWATKDCLSDLVEFARREQKNAAGNPDLIDVLAQFSDPSAAEAIALQLPNPRTRDKAGQALLKLGPVADKAVLGHINDPDDAVQKDARDLARRLKISDQRQLEQTLADVADTRVSRSRAALRHLAKVRPDDAIRAKVSAALNTTLLDPARGLSDESLKALRVWGTPENTVALLKMLGPYENSSMGRNARVIEFLGALKDPRLPPLSCPVWSMAVNGPSSARP